MSQIATSPRSPSSSGPSNRKNPPERISMTLPAELLLELDKMIDARNMPNRSHSIAEMIHREVSAWKEAIGDQVMTGTITLFYNSTKRNLQSQLARIQRQHIAEVISSLHVQLEANHTMEVLVIQGPARSLRAIADKLIACKGVKSGNLNLTSTLMPPIHNRTS